MNILKSIEHIFLSDLQFAKSYLSLHYPFTEVQLYRYAPYLHKGDAHYSVYMDDTGAIYSPQYGLCFNRNIHWTEELKRGYTVGFWNPFVGHYDGLPGWTMEYTEIAEKAKEGLYGIIPLDIHADLNQRETLCYQAAYSAGERYWAESDFEGFYGEEIENKPYSKLTDAEFIELYNRNNAIILYNDSIWEHTLSEVFTEDFMLQVMDCIIKDLGATEVRPIKAIVGYPIFTGSDEPHSLELSDIEI